MIVPIFVIRRILVDSWGIPADRLTDDFWWADELGPEDSCWFLSEIRNAYPGAHLFKPSMSEGDMAEIRTVRQLADYVTAALEAPGVDYWR